MSRPTTDDRPAPCSLPLLSVVIASSNDDRVLSQCVAALAPQAADGDVELFVVRASDHPSFVDRSRWATTMPWLRWIDAPRASTVPQLRALGIAASRAENIALLEDDCVIGDGWCRTATAPLGDAVAAGGAVEPGPYRRALDWAVYLAEYARFMLPLSSTADAPIPGNNAVYSRRALLDLPAALQADFRDAFVHALWQRSGARTTVRDSLVVRNVNSWSGRYVTSVPFQHGRAFAGQRFEGRNPLVRAGFAVLVIGLPLLKVARIMSETLRRGRLLGPLLRATPLIFVFALSWSAGEFVGCLAGAGDSPSRWR